MMLKEKIPNSNINFLWHLCEVATLFLQIMLEECQYKLEMVTDF